MILRTTGNVNLRTGQGTHHSSLGVVSPAAQVVGLDCERGLLGTLHFLSVTVNGKQGFMQGRYLTEGSAPQTFARWEHGHAVVGVHGPSAELWAWLGVDEENQRLVRAGRFESVKVLCAADAGLNVVQVVQNNGAQVHVTRTYIDMTSYKTPAQYVEEVKESARNLYAAGVRYFEVHNEPNLKQEGWGVNWQNGAEFARWWIEVVRLLKALMPLAKFGFAPLSPGHATEFRADPVRFFEEARSAWEKADWLAFHVYWQGTGNTGVDGALAAVRAFATAHPSKVILVTEFSNPSDLSVVPADEKGRQYVRLYQGARNLPDNVGGLYLFVLDNPGFESESLRVLGIASMIGSR
jgi:uncharacterized protein YraI